MSKIRLVNDEIFGVGFQGDVRVWIGWVLVEMYQSSHWPIKGVMSLETGKVHFRPCWLLGAHRIYAALVEKKKKKRNKKPNFSVSEGDTWDCNERHCGCPFCPFWQPKMLGTFLSLVLLCQTSRGTMGCVVLGLVLTQTSGDCLGSQILEFDDKIVPSIFLHFGIIWTSSGLFLFLKKKNQFFDFLFF